MIELLAQEQQGGNPLTFLIFLLPLGLLFFMMRSQKRKVAQQQALQRSADVGDEITDDVRRVRDDRGGG